LLNWRTPIHGKSGFSHARSRFSRERARIEDARAFSASIESKRGSRFLS
jgi:hypothetical protein